MAEMSAAKFHALADLFPLLDGEEFDALVADIRAYGLRQEIILFEGMILDGRNRYAACLEAGIEPRFEQFNGADPLAFVISLNLARRHLSESQRAIVAAKIATMRHGGDRRPQQDANLHLAVSRASAASMLNVSPRSVATAAQVLDHGAPELIEAVEKGEIAVSKAVSSFSTNKDAPAMMALAARNMANSAQAAFRTLTAAQEKHERTGFSRLEQTGDECLAENPDMQTAITDFVHRVRLDSSLERTLAEIYLQTRRNETK
jgi:hypothetical protein